MNLLQYLPENRRPLIGALALLLLASGGALFLWMPEHAAALQLVRAGMVLGVLWLALPELQNPRNRWWMLCLLAVVLAIVLLPRYLSGSLMKLIPIIVVGIVIMKILRPRVAAKPRR